MDGSKGVALSGAEPARSLMKTERWNKVIDLFQSALEHAPEERAAFLNESCHDDEDMRREVESLLASHERAENFIEVPAFKAAPEFVPNDSTGAMVAGRPSPVTNGTIGKVRWLYEKPVLQSIQSYVVLDISGRNGVRTGDEVEFYQPRQGPVDGRDIAIPEIYIARAQVLRVTPYGATAIITGQEQTRLEEGTAARVAAKMP